MIQHAPFMMRDISCLKIKKIAVVHGEEDQSLTFAKHLEDEGFTAFVPRAGDMAYV
jgi:metallo-beta-lactamase family protein